MGKIIKFTGIFIIFISLILGFICGGFTGLISTINTGLGIIITILGNLMEE